MALAVDQRPIAAAEDPNTIVRALEDVWVNSTKSDGEELQRQLQGCMALIPQEDVVKPWTEQASYAQDAGISVAYALRTRISGEAQDAACSAQTAYESLDNFVLNREDIDTNQSGGEARVFSHPLVQAELARQLRGAKSRSERVNAFETADVGFL